MKFIEILGLSLLIINCGNSSGQQENHDPNQVQYKRHVDRENGFTIEYPENWEIIDTFPQPHILLVIRENNSDTSDIFSETMNLTKIPHEGKSLEQWVEENLIMFEQYRPDFKLESKKFLIFKELETVLIKAELEERGVKLSNNTYVIIKGPSLYALTQTAEASKDTKYKQIFEHAINTLELIEK